MRGTIAGGCKQRSTTQVSCRSASCLLTRLRKHRTDLSLTQVAPPRNNASPSALLDRWLSDDDSRERARTLPSSSESALGSQLQAPSVKPGTEAAVGANCGREHALCETADEIVSHCSTPQSSDGDSCRSSAVPTLTERSAPSSARPETVSTALLMRRQMYALSIHDIADDDVEHVRVQDDDEPRTHFPCPLYFLRCDLLFEDPQRWRDHAKTHFRMREPPKHIRCPLKTCSGLDATYDDGAKAWEARMEHLAEHHRQLQGLRPNEWNDKEKLQGLFEHLWNIKLIDAAELKQLKTAGTMAFPPKACLVPHRANRRREGHRVPHSISVGHA